MNATADTTVTIPGTTHTITPSPRFPIEEFTDVCGLRNQMCWGKFTVNKNFTGQRFLSGVMVGVRFEAEFHGSGCGGEYTGHAVGTLYEEGKFSGEGLRKLRFDYCNGTFYDKETGERLREVTALVLGENLHARYLP